MHCPTYARRTPAIPVHNGHQTCLGCGFDVAAYRSAARGAGYAAGYADAAAGRGFRLASAPRSSETDYAAGYYAGHDGART
jgi:hypothetical protein